ncbi:MAG: DUF1573 domain-containing protein [Clostridia bacterium]|jgi:predicted house-cleaning noncanonical NTP pyrophosphatase (MazG superfamily)|nr:DUF1573 domain-containing protein [Clostridia bacterium]
MKDSLGKEFQKTVDQYLIRHKSILDILSKSHHANSKVNRAVTKAITQCGCLEVHSHKKKISEDTSLPELTTCFERHLTGEVCESCREMIEEEMGRQFFYLAALCNTLGLSMDEIIQKENEKVLALRYFNLT